MDSQSPPGGGGTGPHRPPAAAEFPAGLRVLLVDDDRTCLSIVAAMLKKCLYQVTTCKTGMEALDILRNNRGGFDIVLSDVYMPDMDGFKLLEHVGLEMDLPVIMMSADDKKDVVMKGVTHGACDYLIKPVSMEALKNIWQHVFRKKRNELKDLENSGSLEENGKQRVAASEEDADGDIVSSGNEENWKVVKRKKDGEDEDEFDECEDTSTLKKPRVVWSVDLHQQFVAAVNQLGLDKAVPKKILELMNNPALTRENVASHLQKYRLYLKRVSVPQHQGRADVSFPSTPDSSYSSITSLDGFELQALAASGQLPQALVNLHPGPRRHTNICMDMAAADQRGFFTSDAPMVNSSKIRPAMVQQVNNNQMNLLYGSPVSMETRQIGQAQQMFRSYGNMGFRVSEGAQGFMGFPSSLRTSSAFSGGTINGHSSNSIVMQMNQHSQQVSLAQQQDHIQIGVKQPQSRGQILNGIASERDSRVSSTIGQQMVSNGTSNVLVRTGTATNGGTSLQGNYMNMPPYGAVSQSLYPNVLNSSMNGSSCHPHVNSIALANQTSTVMIQEAMTAAPGGLEALDIVPSLNGVRDAIPNYDMFNDLQQNKNQEWKLQNVISYESSQQQGTKQSNIDYGCSQVATHQDFNATLNDGVARNAGTFRKERFLIRAEIEHEQLECLPQDGLFADDISHELMSVFGRQPQEPVGPVEMLPFEA